MDFNGSLLNLRVFEVFLFGLALFFIGDFLFGLVLFLVGEVFLAGDFRFLPPTTTAVTYLDIFFGEAFLFGLVFLFAGDLRGEVGFLAGDFDLDDFLFFFPPSILESYY